MASGLHKNYTMDHTKEQNGVRIEFQVNDDNSVPTFIVARMGPMNQKYNKALERITHPYKRQLELRTLPNEKAEELMQKVFVNSILLGWEHVQDENGQDIVFSAENALALFKQLPDIYYDLQRQAQDASLFRLEEQEAAAKN